jgi:hypothetical protein
MYILIKIGFFYQKLALIHKIELELLIGNFD